MHIWAGVDAGKTGHHCVAIDTDGTRLLSRKVSNDEVDLTALIAEVNALGTDVTWATDLNRGGASLMIALLHAHGQRLMYIPGRTVHHASRIYRGDGKTDAKDAAVIADQARMRHDLQPLRISDEASADLRILTSRRADKAEDRTRAINRLRATLLEYFPALEAAFDYSRSKAALTLLTRHNTPDGIRRCGQTRLQSWLKNQGARSSAAVAEAAVAAARKQQTIVPGQRSASLVVAGLAAEVLRVQSELAELDALIAERGAEHPHTGVITSMPGFGPLLAAEFLAATGGDMVVFEGPDRLAAVAGLAPVPRDSGKITGNHRRPQRYDRRLLRVFYLAALSSLKSSPESRAYFDRKRAEGKSHIQAILCLARRRVNVLWAMLRDRTHYAPPGRTTALTAAA
ncbi:IS110 family transposase [Sinomonas sp. G460-2]|uniref:IS110 family transposase n=1 Tax=Sinomonas sp. G460-2 TaxID=3393464 RepID=UPI0039F10391